MSKYHIPCPVCGDTKTTNTLLDNIRICETCNLPVVLYSKVQSRIDQSLEDLERKYNLLEHAYKQLEDDYNNDVLATQENW